MSSPCSISSNENCSGVVNRGWMKGLVPCEPINRSLLWVPRIRWRPRKCWRITSVSTNFEIPSYTGWIGLNITTTDGRDGLGGIHASVRLPQPTHTLAHTDHSSTPTSPPKKLGNIFSTQRRITLTSNLPQLAMYPSGPLSHLNAAPTRRSFVSCVRTNQIQSLSLRLVP